MSSRPPIFQMLLVGFAVLSVLFVSISTVVAVSTSSPPQAITRPAPVAIERASPKLPALKAGQAAAAVVERRITAAS